mmetsp:Transcript_87984/g.152085  ORF Transcript_87984/g.152085 Transcript_87984/m.152085 type:complete len:528 (+) Transcript_87984:49-1632(+)
MTTAECQNSTHVAPREKLRLRRIVRRAASLAGLPALSMTQEENEIQATSKKMVLARSCSSFSLQPQSAERCEMSTPEFTMKGGKYEHQVVVGIDAVQGTEVRYTVERISDDGVNNDHLPTIHSRLYRKPFVLDEPGVYIVRAVAVQKDRMLWRSEVATMKYVVTPGSMGKRLRALPKHMINGMVTFAGAAESCIASKIKSMRFGLAQAANVAQSSVSMAVRRSPHKHTEGVEVAFSVEVDRADVAESMVERITDPSLVTTIAKFAGVQAWDVGISAKKQELEDVMLSLGWQFPATSSDGNGEQSAKEDYLDGSCLIYSEESLIDVVDYRGAQSVNGENVSKASCKWSAGAGQDAGVLHSGDVMSRDRGSHAIRVRLSALPAYVTDCFFVLSAYYCRDLSRFVSPSMQLFDAQNPTHLLSRYSVFDAGSASAVTVCSLTREGDTWIVQAYSQTSDGTVRDYTPIEVTVAKIQARYERVRRRFPLIRLAALWQDDRVMLRGQGNAHLERLILPLIELRPELFRLVIQYV